MFMVTSTKTALARAFEMSYGAQLNSVLILCVHSIWLPQGMPGGEYSILRFVLSADSPINVVDRSICADSGIPTYREKLSGVWAGNDPRDLEMSADNKNRLGTMTSVSEVRSVLEPSIAAALTYLLTKCLISILVCIERR